MDNNFDVSKLSNKALQDLSKILATYKTENDISDISEYANDNVHIGYNKDHDNVYLYSEEYPHSVMMNGDKLDTFHSCWNCGHEGFKEDVIHEPLNSDCEEFLEPFLAELKKEKLKELLK